MTEAAGAPPRTGPSRLPGDPDHATLVAQIIRVDHAGEYGARRIYEGQLAVLGRDQRTAAIQRMAAQEERHLARFEELVVERRVRPTALTPLWNIAGFALGAATAMMGARAAMACTAAVEETIDAHYRDQAARLGEDEAELRDTIEAFRAEEREHRDTALRHGAEEAPGYEALRAAIHAGSKLAIWLSTRL